MNATLTRRPAADLRRVITYDGLPISAGGGHTLRIRDTATAWDACAEFFGRCTDSAMPECRLQLYNGPRGHAPWARTLLSECRERFGWRMKDWEERLYNGEDVYTWNLRPVKLRPVLDYLASVRPWPQHYIGPLLLQANYNFRLCDPASGEVLPYQDGRYDFGDPIGHPSQSGARVTVTDRVKMSVWLMFPFENANNEFVAYLSKIKPFVPFPFSEKHWRIWQPCASRAEYRPRKMEPSFLART